MQKKNDDLCSQFESNAGGGIGNELFEIENTESPNKNDK